MPRPLVFSNGSFLLALDAAGSIRDLFYPQVGRWNHLSGHRIRTGVWAAAEGAEEGGFSWTDTPEWSHEQRYRACSLVGASSIENAELGLQIQIHETVSHREPWYVRQLRVRNLTREPLEVRLFFTHDLRIMESDIGDTAFYHPGMDGIVHYKGPCYFLFSGHAGSGGVFEYACGLKGFGGFEGTWRDAEDGELSNNPIAQGSVDSTLSLSLDIEAGGAQEATYYIVASEDLESLERASRSLRDFGPENVLSDTEKHWRSWCGPTAQNLGNLPKQILDLCEQSLLLMRAHIDNDGAIIAAIDSDIMETNRANYCYTWPRDGALISAVLDNAGHHHLPRAFFEFCGRVLPKHPPLLRQKYVADGTLGATWHPWIIDGKPQTPFQEDETALTLMGVWHHHQAYPDDDALKHHWERLVRPAADFIAEYRDDTTGLPGPSYDLWEERLGIHTYTVCSVIAGLRAAADVASHLSHRKKSEKYVAAAADFAGALLEHLVDPSTGAFFRRIMVENGSLIADPVVDSSTLHVGLLGILPIDDPRVIATAALVEKRLWIEGLGGLARYEGDYYFRRHEHLPGNPWIICTLWLAQHRIKVGDLDGAMDLISWCYDRAAPTGVLPEQVDAVSGEHLSVSPLTWSHAEFVQTCFAFARSG